MEGIELVHGGNRIFVPASSKRAGNEMVPHHAMPSRTSLNGTEHKSHILLARNEERYYPTHQNL